MSIRSLLAINPILYRFLAAIWLLGTLLLLFLPGESLPKESLIPYQDKVAHFVLFAGYAFLWTKSFPEKSKFSRLTYNSTVLLFGIIIGSLSEIIQQLIPGREGDWIDFSLDVVGLTAGFLFAFLTEKRNQFGND